LLNIFSFLFGLIVKKRNKWFDNNQNKIVKSDFPVISVGNLSVGGTGKTPFVIELCKILKELGFSPCVIGMGYKRKSKNDILVSDGEKILVDATVGGDEMILIAQKAISNNLKIPVIAGKSKSKTVQTFLATRHTALDAESPDNNDDARRLWVKPAMTGKNRNSIDTFNIKSKIDCIIIDDGFQHRKLFRDLDIVLIDNSSLLKPFLLPKGRLREPFDSLVRADIICLTKNATKENFLKIYPTDKPILETNFKLNKYYSLFEKSEINLTKTITVSGIAKPEIFIEMLKNEMLKNGEFEILETLNFADHHNFSERDIKKIFEICTVNNCFNISITEKDAVKFFDFEKIFAENKINIFVHPLELNIYSGKEDLKKMLERLRKI